MESWKRKVNDASNWDGKLFAIALHEKVSRVKYIWDQQNLHTLSFEKQFPDRFAIRWIRGEGVGEGC